MYTGTNVSSCYLQDGSTRKDGCSESQALIDFLSHVQNAETSPPMGHSSIEKSSESPHITEGRRIRPACLELFFEPCALRPPTLPPFVVCLDRKAHFDVATLRVTHSYTRWSSGLNGHSLFLPHVEDCRKSMVTFFFTMELPSDCAMQLDDMALTSWPLCNPP